MLFSCYAGAAALTLLISIVTYAMGTSAEAGSKQWMLVGAVIFWYSFGRALCKPVIVCRSCCACLSMFHFGQIRKWCAGKGPGPPELHTCTHSCARKAHVLSLLLGQTSKCKGWR